MYCSISVAMSSSVRKRTFGALLRPIVKGFGETADNLRLPKGTHGSPGSYGSSPLKPVGPPPKQKLPASPAGGPPTTPPKFLADPPNIAPGTKPNSKHGWESILVPGKKNRSHFLAEAKQARDKAAFYSRKAQSTQNPSERNYYLHLADEARQTEAQLKRYASNPDLYYSTDMRGLPDYD